MYTNEQTRDLQLLTKQLLESAPSVGQLRDVLRFHEYRYYIANDPLISDVEYDTL
jgi:DNA ligase (NAD+)